MPPGGSSSPSLGEAIGQGAQTAEALGGVLPSEAGKDVVQSVATVVPIGAEGASAIASVGSQGVTVSRLTGVAQSAGQALSALDGGQAAQIGGALAGAAGLASTGVQTGSALSSGGSTAQATETASSTLGTHSTAQAAEGVSEDKSQELREGVNAEALAKGKGKGKGSKKQLMKHSNVAETSRAFAEKTGTPIYGDWLQHFGHTVSLMATGALQKPEMTKLLRFSLMQHQLNATYSAEDSGFLERQTSPIAFTGYARGMRTGLWDAATSIQKAKLPKGIKGFHVVLVSSPVTGFGGIETMETNSPDFSTERINDKSNVHVPSLGLQLIKTDDARGWTKGKIDSELGARGLRKSPGEAAVIVADTMAGLIDAKKPADALKLIRDVVGSNRNAKSGKQALAALELNPNTLVVQSADGHSIDPLRESSTELIERVSDLYSSLTPRDTDPFYVQQNLKVVNGLIGNDIKSLFGTSTPSIVSAAVADTLADVYQLVQTARQGEGAPSHALDQANNLLVEKLYQSLQQLHDLVRFQLDWSGAQGPTLETAVRNLLPSSAPTPQAVLSKPHALAMINELSSALGDDARSVAIMKGAYYETPHLFPGGQQVEHVTDEALKGKKVIVLEPHPNNAAETEIHPHSATDLFENLFDTDTGNHTVLIDLTLNHLGEPEVKTILDAAQTHIDSGKLNLVLVQSGTKFYQNGMDLVNVGIAITLNNGSAGWKSFNDATQASQNPLPAEDQAYVARMLDKNGQQLMDYLDKIRRNTADLRARLAESLGQDNAFTLSESTDPQTVYVSFRPTDAYVAQVSGKSVTELIDEDRMKVNQDVYFKHVLPALRGAMLPAVDRTSFGFNVTNFGECATTVRITPGIEDTAFFVAYGQVVADVGAKLAAALKASPAHVSEAAGQGSSATAEGTATPTSSSRAPDAAALAESGLSTTAAPAPTPAPPSNALRPEDWASRRDTAPISAGRAAGRTNNQIKTQLEHINGQRLVYSLGEGPTIEANVANLIAKRRPLNATGPVKGPHIRVSEGQLGTLDAQDKLTIVAHGGQSTFGGKSAEELALHLGGAGVTALGILSLKGCDSAAFASELMGELKAKGITVGRITGRDGKVTITSDGHTLVSKDPSKDTSWMHQAPGTKAEVRIAEDGHVSQEDAYGNRTDLDAIETQSEELRQRTGAGALGPNDEDQMSPLMKGIATVGLTVAVGVVGAYLYNSLGSGAGAGAAEAPYQEFASPEGYPDVESGLAEFRAYLNGGENPTIRVYADGTNGMGHQSSSVAVMRRLVESEEEGGLGYEGTIEIIYGDPTSDDYLEKSDIVTRDKVKQLLPEIDFNGKGPYKLGGATVQLRRGNETLQVVNLGFTGGADDPPPPPPGAKPRPSFAKNLQVNYFLRLQPYLWPQPDQVQRLDESPPLEMRKETVLGKEAFKFATMHVEQAVEPSWSSHDGSKLEEQVAVAHLLCDRLDEIDVAPLYGMRQSQNPMNQYAAYPLFTTAVGALDSQLNGGSPIAGRKPAVLLNISNMQKNQLLKVKALIEGEEADDEVQRATLARGNGEHYDSSASLEARRAYLRDLGARERIKFFPDPSQPDAGLSGSGLKTALDDLAKGGPGVLVVQVDKLPPEVFSHMFSVASLPGVFEGQNTAAQALRFGKPYLHVSGGHFNESNPPGHGNAVMYPTRQNAQLEDLAFEVQDAADQMKAQLSSWSAENNPAKKVGDFIKKAKSLDSEIAKFFKEIGEHYSDKKNCKLTHSLNFLNYVIKTTTTSKDGAATAP